MRQQKGRELERLEKNVDAQLESHRFGHLFPILWTKSEVGVPVAVHLVLF